MTEQTKLINRLYDSVLTATANTDQDSTLSQFKELRKITYEILASKIDLDDLETIKGAVYKMLSDYDRMFSIGGMSESEKQTRLLSDVVDERLKIEWDNHLRANDPGCQFMDGVNRSMNRSGL